MIQNFLILHQEGCVYNRSFSGEELDLLLVTGFSSSVSTFLQYIFKQQRGSLTAMVNADQGKLSEFVVAGQRFLFEDVGSFTLVIQANSAVGQSILSIILNEIKMMLTVLVFCI